MPFPILFADDEFLRPIFIRFDAAMPPRVAPILIARTARIFPIAPRKRREKRNMVFRFICPHIRPFPRFSFISAVVSFLVPAR